MARKSTKQSERKNVENRSPSSPGFLARLGESKGAFSLAVVALVAVFAWMYLMPMNSLDDRSAEAIDQLMAAGLVVKARAADMSYSEYLQSDPMVQTVDREEFTQTHCYYRGRFWPEYFLGAGPLLVLSYIPFVQLWGMTPNTVMIYSTFFTVSTLLLLFGLVAMAYGRWHGLLSVLFLLSMLPWLIHAKVAYASWVVSAPLIASVAFCMFLHARSGRSVWILLASVVTGLLLLTGWISVVFSGMIVALMAALSLRKAFLKTLLALAAGGVLAALVVGGGVYASAMYFRYDAGEMTRTLWDAFSMRYTQGSVPAAQGLGTGAKCLYGLRCLFVDMKSFDHLDKCLEGHPAIPWVMSLFFFVGLGWALRFRRKGDCVLLVWGGSILGLLISGFYLYQHRYALMAFPAVAAVAAVGVMETGRWLVSVGQRIGAFVLGGVVLLLLVMSLGVTHQQYYETYLKHKTPDFEVDRIRGPASQVRFLKEGYDPKDTLVILGDPVMFSWLSFWFHTFDRPYPFAFWSSHFGSTTKPAELLAWESEALSKYKRIVYFFSPTFFPGRVPNTILNDCRPFFAAHPNLRPVWSYSYAGRNPSMVAFEVTRP